MRVRVVIAVAVVAVLVAAPSAFSAPKASVAATAVAASKATTAAASRATTRTYDLDFTLPTLGKSGCLVCHGDPNLAKISLEVTSSIYVDVSKLQDSAHKADTPCTGCHLDFAYTSPHKQSANAERWQGAAKSACKNCHKQEFSDYANGAHSPAGEPGVDASVIAASRNAKGRPALVPLCGDCHGGHSIPASDNVSAMNALHRSGNEMCGQCHEREANNYEDYYHGAAYRRGSLDAPSCWDCHGFHSILPVTERTSPVHPSRLSETCGQEGCHTDVDAGFLAYAKLIHGQQKIRSANPVVSVVDRVRQTVRSAFATVKSWFQRDRSEVVARPMSRREKG